MSKKLKLYQIAGSPNNIRIRLALAYKGLAYETEDLELTEFPGDRSRIVELSGQPRMPVLQHGETVIFDSWSILRYLDANFRDTPKLYSDDYVTFGEIESWEQVARSQLGEPVGMIYQQVMAPQCDDSVCKTACELMNERTSAIEGKLSEYPFLMGEDLTAADLACAPLINLAMLTDSQAATSPIKAFFQAKLKIGEDRERTKSWVERVIAFDK